MPLLSLAQHAVDVAGHVEGLLWDVVQLAVNDHLETAHCLFEGHKDPRLPGEFLGDKEGLGTEVMAPLDVETMRSSSAPTSVANVGW